MNYTNLSFADLIAEFERMAQAADAVFGWLSERQLNWRPDEGRWSVAQCFDHLLTANAKMFQSMDVVMSSPGRRTLWQRIPLLSRVSGAIMIKSLAPDTKRRLTAPRQARPAATAIDKQIIQRFVAHQHEAAERVRAIDRRDAGRLVMVSPFVSFVTYSVLDGCRIIATHQRRHFEQARRVIQASGFPPH